MQRSLANARQHWSCPGALIALASPGRAHRNAGTAAARTARRAPSITHISGLHARHRAFAGGRRLRPAGLALH